MLHLIKSSGLGNISCYTRPKTNKGFAFLEEQRQRLQGKHSYYYIWDAELKRDANKWEYNV